MRSKSIIQIFIILTIFLTSYIVYQKFFSKKLYKDNELVTSDKSDGLSLDSENKDSKNNTILNLEYKSTDTMGNKYIIKSETAESNLENEDQLTLIKVSAIIYLYKKPAIFISSDFAKHDKSSFNTNFYENVKIKYNDVNVESRNLDLIYDNNLISLYNITKAFNKNTKLEADRIDFDMLTKDASINMYKKNERVSIVYK